MTRLPHHTPDLGAATALRAAAAVICVFALGAVVLSATGFLREAQRIEEETRLLAAGAAVDVDRYVQSQFRTLRALAASETVRDLDLAGMEALLDRSTPSSLGFDGGIFWVDASGLMRVRSDDDGAPLDLSARDYVRAVLDEGEPYVGSVLIGAVSRAPVVALAIPTHDDAGHPTGVLAGAFRLDETTSGVDSLRFAGATEIEIVDRLGHLVIGVGPMDELQSAAAGLDVPSLRRAGAGVRLGVVGPHGMPDRLVGFATAGSADWLVIVDRPMGASFGAARELLAVQLALVAIAGSIAIATTLAAARRVGEADRRRARALAAEQAATTELARAVAQLQSREQLRDAFVGVLSHELRTPVTSIYGAAKLLAKSPDRPDRESLVEDIEDESDRLYRMIEDLLVLSRAERGRLEVSPEPVLVQRLMPAVEGDLRRRFPGAPFSLGIPDSLPPVAAEPGPLRQVLNNLLTNAAKYGAGTEVRLLADTDGDVVRIVVEDSGLAFTDEEAAQLFELFYRAPGSARLAAGTGIGLYVVRQLIEAMGGTVAAARRPEGGARFTVTLPVFDETMA